MAYQWVLLAVMVALKMAEFAMMVTLQPGERPIVPNWRNWDGREHGRRGDTRAGPIF